jgi:hypothetical protein
MVVAAYNAAQHESTEYSPYYLMYGREYRTPLDLTLDTPEVAPQNQSDYIAQLHGRIWSAFVTVNKRLQTKTQRMNGMTPGFIHYCWKSVTTYCIIVLEGSQDVIKSGGDCVQSRV